MQLEMPVEKLKFVGAKYAPRLKKLGIETVKDLLDHFPHRYEDYSAYIPIEAIKQGKNVSVLGQIISVENKRTSRRRLVLTNAVVKDQGSEIKAVWYNQPYLVRILKQGTAVSLSGNVKLNKYGLYFQNPSYEVLKKPTANRQPPNNILKHTGRLVPVYSETEGISSRYLRFLIQPLLKFAASPEWLPEGLRLRQGLLALTAAYQQIHFPDSHEKAQSSRRRFAFEELLLLQLRNLQAKKLIKQQQARPIKFSQSLIQSFVRQLPFELTNSQRLALWEILQDLEKDHPMNRLLNGDVGSGKTVVAAAAALQVAHAGHCVAFLAPTEVLAMQHFDSLKKLFKAFKVAMGLLTGSGGRIWNGEKDDMLNKSRMRKSIAQSEIRVIVGTHAIIQKNTAIPKLALAIVDEQHRFGVEQRAALVREHQSLDVNYQPHLLSMTATPIPRTLALSIYGDLDISFLSDMPKGRKKIITSLVPPQKRKAAYQFINEQIKSGRQVFVICPRIDIKNIDSNYQLSTISYQRESRKQLSFKEATTLEKKAVVSEYGKLKREVFPDLRIAMLHGKMRPKEKEKIMQQFKQKKFDMLVATSVIEVGVDVPNAAIMMIEGAEHFGLAQLHQFRGRVGRGEHQSYCFLFIESPLIGTTRRLTALVKHHSGFKLAEMDLKIRGPGEFLGTVQSGIPDLAMASLDDLELIQAVRIEAEWIIKNGLEKYPAVAAKLIKFQKEVHLE